MMYSKIDHIGIIEEIARGLAISENNQRYLELGIAKAKCFNRVAKYFDVSDAVDISSVPEHYIDKVKLSQLLTHSVEFTQATTDEFFKNNKDKRYNLIFIDANHHYESVKTDFLNALNVLAPGGLIILHDTYAPDAESATHCYDAWKIQDISTILSDIQLINLPVFYGLTIVQRVSNKEFWYDDK